MEAEATVPEATADANGGWYAPPAAAVLIVLAPDKDQWLSCCVWEKQLCRKVKNERAEWSEMRGC